MSPALGPHSRLTCVCSVTLLRPLLVSSITASLPASVWPGPGRPSAEKTTASCWASCPRNQEVERMPSRFLGTGRCALAPSVKMSGGAEEGSSEEAGQMQDASRVPGGVGRRGEKRGASGTQGEVLPQAALPARAGENESGTGRADVDNSDHGKIL